MSLKEIVLKNRSYRRFYQDRKVSVKELEELVDIARNVADKILELIDCEKNKQKKEYETILVESEFFKGKSVIKL